MNILNRIAEVFRNKYGADPLVFRSPGRVNIIGEHTDYNEGYVLPAAIDKYIYIAIAPRTDKELHLFSQDFQESLELNLEQELRPVPSGWPNYILGVVDQLKQINCPLSGFNLVIDGDVPIGAGLSSSAAVECATAFALNDLFKLGLEKLEMVKLAQQAEHSFAGVRCGIMDQFASMFGKKGHAIKLDCRSLEFEYVPLDLKGYKIVLLNSNVKHSLASTEYNTRREQCEQGVAWVKEHHPQVISLRDADLDMLTRHVLNRDELIYRRCKYVVEENQRLSEACEDLKKGDLQALGKKMFRSHEGLSREYEVSCRELDLLVKAVENNPAVLGARMMGGGFGGCTINLVKEEAIKELVEGIRQSYQQQTGLELTYYIADIENGSGLA